MEIREVNSNKENFMEILLIGDEEVSMINKYLESSTLFVLYDNDILISICAVMEIDSETVEIKNLATYPQYRNKGCASQLLDFVFNRYKKKFKTVILGTGENEITLNFYKKRGFVQTRRIKKFFIDNYSHPIFENGRQLVDMIYLAKSLTEKD